MRPSTPLRPVGNDELLPVEHNLALVPALITDAQFSVFCCVKRKGCIIYFDRGAVCFGALIYSKFFDDGRTLALPATQLDPSGLRA